MAMTQDELGNWYDDGQLDWWGEEPVTTNASWTPDPYGAGSGYGQDTLTNMGATNDTKPAGAVGLNEIGQWVDKLGKVLAPVSPILSAFASPYINNAITGGLINDSRDLLKSAGSGIANIKMPDLMSMIPKLQLQVQQGVMTPAQAQAAMAELQGKMSPEQYTAVQAVMQGKMTPSEAIANEQAASGMKDVTSDQATILGARNALGQLDDIATNRGMTEADRAAFAAFMNQTNANTAQQRAAQIQQLQMQGNAGTGTELAARLSGIQGGANTNAAAGANMAQAAQARALQAIQSGLQGNTALNQQLFGQDASKAQAQDLVNQFNAQAKNAVSLANAQMAQQAGLANFNTGNQFALANQQAANQAGQYNAGNRQASNLANYEMANRLAMQNAQNQQATNLANAGYGQQANLTNFNMANDINRFNTDILNKQAMLPMTTADKQFQNSLAQQTNAAKAQLGAGTGLSNLATGILNRANTAAGAQTSGATQTPGATTQPSSSNKDSGDDWLNRIGKVAGIVGSVASIFSDEELKKDKHELSDNDVDDMMGNLTGFKYRYRGDNNNPQQTGVMAQDMEQGMPDSVVDTPAGKMIQKPEALSEVLAVLANNNSRLRKLEGK